MDIQIHVEHLSSIGVIERCDKEEEDRFNERHGNIQSREKIFKKLNFYQQTCLGDGIYSFLRKAIAVRYGFLLKSFIKNFAKIVTN